MPEVRQNSTFSKLQMLISDFPCFKLQIFKLQTSTLKFPNFKFDKLQKKQNLVYIFIFLKIADSQTYSDTILKRFLIFLYLLK